MSYDGPLPAPPMPPLPAQIRAAHAAACRALHHRGEPSCHAPGSLDVLKELRDVGGDTDQWTVRRYCRAFELPLADV